MKKIVYMFVCKPIMIEGDKICLFEDIFFQLAQAIPDID